MFERKDIRTHHDAINALISKYCEENGLAFDPKSISYTENEINYKCTIRATDEAGNVSLDPWDKMAIDSLIKDAPEEWQELCALLEYRKQTKPCAFCKLNKPIYEKLKANPPKLKNQYKVIKE